MENLQVSFIDGLLWYLETRNWAFARIKACPIGSLPQDIKMYHYLYFSNLLGAVDLVDDFVRALGKISAFSVGLEHGFSGQIDFKYVRELRNAIVHRGLDPAAAGHANDNVILVLCPPHVCDRAGHRTYTCTFKYTTELAECCNRVVNTAIFEALETNGFLSSGKLIVSKEQVLDDIKCSTAMPDWAKSMAQNALDDMDFDKAAAKLEETRIKRLKALLDRE